MKMATRRPRVKAAAILKPRRIPTTVGQNTGDKNIKTELTADVRPTSSDEQQNNENGEQLISTSNRGLRPSEVKYVAQKVQNGNEMDNSNENKSIEIDILPKSPTLMAMKSPVHLIDMDLSSKSIRRPSTPSINRRKSVINTENRQFSLPSPNYIKSPPYSSFVRDTLQQNRDTKPNTSPYSVNHQLSRMDDDILSPGPVDGDFKSPPFMSPSFYSRRNDPSMSPFNETYNEDYTKSPSSSNSKIRQRIRPTPCFASRRNSINCVTSDVEDEQNRRQRHYSTSSTHSNYNPAMTPQYQKSFSCVSRPHPRVRTESFNSSISDAPYIRDYVREITSKMKRSHRSEEYQRVANAKREFNQRLNGKPPDKSRLTMYDLIYYNPLTNPMSKPAGKGDKSSDSVSNASVRTNQSRSSGSVKSEASKSASAVKAEHPPKPVTELMPVPQLKLGANGEIVLDEKSLVIETTTDKEAREMLATTEVVYDDEFSGTSGFYKRQKRTRDWLPLETIKFYRSLQTIGTDFSVMLQLFPNRSRRDLKLKFKKEEKYNMALINKALLHPKEFNVDELKLQFDKEDEEIELKKQEWAHIRKKMNIDRKEQLLAAKRRNPRKLISASMRHLTGGDFIYENEFVILPKARRPRAKRQPSTDAFEEYSTKNSINESLHSPVPLNNNHVDSLPMHTYAMHKLPNFTEMLSTQTNHLHPIAFTSTPNSKHLDETSQNLSISSRDSNKSSPNKSKMIADNTISDLHRLEQSTSSSPIKSSNLLNLSPDKNEHLKTGSDDIMNMDIIFENVPIEEDPTIGQTNEKSLNDSDGGVDGAGDAATTSIDKLSINGIQYEIITLNENQQPNDQSATIESTDVINVENVIEPDQRFVYSTDDVVLVAPSVLDVAAEVETSNTEVETEVVVPSNEVEATVETLNTEAEVKIETPSTEVLTVEAPSTVVTAEVEPLNVKFSTQNEATTSQPNNENEAWNLTINKNEKPKDEQMNVQIKTETKTKPNDGNRQSQEIGERKRKRKVVPCLNVRAKRPRPAEIAKPTETIEEKPSETSPNETSSEKPIDKSNQIPNTSHQNEENKECKRTNQVDDNATATTSTTVANDEHKKMKEEAEKSGNFMDSLVVVESQDPNDLNKTLYEVFVVDPETKQMSENPLDLPEDVIHRIRMSM